MSEWQTLEGLHPHGRTRGASRPRRPRCSSPGSASRRISTPSHPLDETQCSPWNPLAASSMMLRWSSRVHFAVRDFAKPWARPVKTARSPAPGGHSVKVDGSQLHSETRKAERAWNELPEEVERRVVAAGGRRLGWSAAANRPSAAASNESRCCPAGHDRFNPAAKNGLAVRRNIGPVHAIRQRGAEVGGFPVS